MRADDPARATAQVEVIVVTAACSSSRSVPADRRRRTGGWSLSSIGLVLAAAAVGLGPLLASAAPGDSPTEAAAIGPDGRFSGTVRPQSARWYRFSYRGGSVLSIVVAYEPAGATSVNFALYTGDPSNPRAESLSPV